MRRLFDLRRTSYALILAAAVGQAVLGWRMSLYPTYTAAMRNPESPAWYRSAVLLEGREFAEFVGFIRQTVPSDARVILPPRLPLRPISHSGFMQYFLFPRDIHNCGISEVEACIRRVTGSKTYIVAVEGFPPADVQPSGKDFVEFDGTTGVYVPR